jgi:hypothetical protein
MSWPNQSWIYESLRGVYLVRCESVHSGKISLKFPGDFAALSSVSKIKLSK